MIFVLHVIVGYEYCIAYSNDKDIFVLHVIVGYEVIVYGNDKDGENVHGKQCINMFIKY